MADITANVVVSMPSQLFTASRSFKALANGKIYIGKVDTDPVIPENQVAVYVENEDGTHVQVAQPIIINAAGLPVYNGDPAKFVTVDSHSMAVYDSYNAQQFYYPNILKYSPDQLRQELFSTEGVNLPKKFSEFADAGSGLKLGSTSAAKIPTINIRPDKDQRLLLTKEVTKPDDLSVLQINRNANYEGGTKGFVGAALVVTTNAKSATTTANYEWAGLFIMNNYVANNQAGGGAGSGAVPQQVALYAQANKFSSSATWAACLEINDNTSTVANGAAIGQEITVRSIGSDTTTPSRIGLHVAAHTPDSNDIGAEWGAAFMATTDVVKQVRFRHVLKVSGIIGDSVIHSSAVTNQNASALIRDVGSLTIGIDLSGATYLSGTAIRLKAGQKLTFDGQDANYLFGGTDGIVVNGGLTLRSSFSIPSAGGNTANTASAGSRAAVPSAVDGYLIFKVDGVSKKIPYFPV